MQRASGTGVVWWTAIALFAPAPAHAAGPAAATSPPAAPPTSATSLPSAPTPNTPAPVPNTPGASAPAPSMPPPAPSTPPAPGSAPSLAPPPAENAPPAAPPPVAPPAPPPPAPSTGAPPPPVEPPPPPLNGVPRAASGFQVAFRSGVLFPTGKASGAPGDSLDRRYAWQIPIVIDLGGRFARSFFLGGYLGFGLGGTGSDRRVDAACTDDDDNAQNDISCAAASFRIGLEMQYSFLPDQHYNPWVGYGIGLEGASASLDDKYRKLKESVTSSGVTYAQLSVGLDVRQKVGFGPFIEVALGQFDRTTTDLGDRGKYRYEISDRALHAWVMFGARIVVNP